MSHCDITSILNFHILNIVCLALDCALYNGEDKIDFSALTSKILIWVVNDIFTVISS